MLENAEQARDALEEAIEYLMANPARTDEFRAGYEFGYGDGQVGEYNPDFRMRRYQANYILVEESFDGLAEVARRLLDAHYPADIPIVCSVDSPDPGARFTGHLREALKAIDGTSHA